MPAILSQLQCINQYRWPQTSKDTRVPPAVIIHSYSIQCINTITLCFNLLSPSINYKMPIVHTKLMRFWANSICVNKYLSHMLFITIRHHECYIIKHNGNREQLMRHNSHSVVISHKILLVIVNSIPRSTKGYLLSVTCEENCQKICIIIGWIKDFAWC